MYFTAKVIVVAQCRFFFGSAVVDPLPDAGKAKSANERIELYLISFEDLRKTLVNTVGAAIVSC